MQSFTKVTGAAVASACLAMAGVPGPHSFVPQAQAAAVQTASSIEHYNITRKGLAIDGYDPVAYFPEGGGKATKGKKSLQLDHAGVTYRFANQANLDRFRNDPNRYRPAYGGWCAWAMTTGDKTDINPKSFRIADDGRLLLFYNGLLGNTRKQWGDQDATLAPKSDGHWQTIAGEAPHYSKERDMKSSEGELTQELHAFKDQWSAQADDETKRVYERGITTVGASGVIETALEAGDRAPVFELPNATGAPVKSADLLANGPVIVTFYRGGWCPYCNIQLRAYQERLADFQSRGASLVAISPETPDHSLSTQEKNELGFEVLSDGGNRVANAFGIAYVLPQEVQDRFKGRLDLNKFNGDDSASLPLAATFVIAQDGTVAWAFVQEDYRERAEPDAIIEALDALGG
ncbi:MAG: peroxiredoxin-like family protein [Planctomycetota bacterium]